MRERIKELPEELWDSILNRLDLDDDDYGDLESPSLVCKRFLSITNRLRRKLVANSNVFYSNRCEVLCKALGRFTNLNEIELHAIGPKFDVNHPISKIASSWLDLRALSFYRFRVSPSGASLLRLAYAVNNLKILRCCEFDSLCDLDLVHIADAFPRLEELDISYPKNEVHHSRDKYPELSIHDVTDAGIEAISHKLRGLRRINISGNKDCSDRSLAALSSNCALLEEIECKSCGVTHDGASFALRHSPNLISLKAGYFIPSPAFPLQNSMVYARALRVLELCACSDVDGLLRSVVKACIPLEKLVVEVPYEEGVTYDPQSLSLDGLLDFLRGCPSLQHLGLDGARFLDDDSMMVLCRYLPNLVSIKLLGPSNLSLSTFFILAGECPELSEITLEAPKLGVGGDFLVNPGRNYRIRYLDLSYTWHLVDELVKRIAVACPNLHKLNVGRCLRITEEGIEEILSCCSQIQHLEVSRHIYMELLSRTFKTCKIKFTDRLRYLGHCN